jgi:hypothetical protein
VRQLCVKQKQISKKGEIGQIPFSRLCSKVGAVHPGGSQLFRDIEIFVNMF